MKKNKLLALLVVSVIMLVGLTACNMDLNAVKINIKTPATKTVYEIGEEFSTKGLIVEAEDANGIKIAMTEDLYEINSGAFDNTKVGEYEIVIKLKANETITAAYKVTVLEANVPTTINIKANSAQKLNYEISETFTAAGLAVEKTMSREGEVIACDNDEYVIDSTAFDNTKAGEYEIVIKLKANEAITAKYKVTVLAPNVVVSIAIKSDSAYKSVFEIAEAFNHEGLIIEKVMSRGNRVICQANEFSVNSDAFDNMASGNYTIIITLAADATKTVSYNVTVSVAKVSSIFITTPAEKLLYEIDDEFSSIGLVIGKLLTDGSTTKCDANEYEIDKLAFDNTKAGSYKIIIKLKADETKTAEYTVTVLAANVATSISIKDTSTNKTEFFVGYDFESNGLIIEKIMSRDGSIVLCGADEYIVDSTAFDNTKAGSYKIIIKLKADETKTAVYAVAVKESAIYVGKYQLTDYKSEQISLSLDILPDGTALSYLSNSSKGITQSGNPLLYTYKVTPYVNGGFILEFTVDSYYYNNGGAMQSSYEYFSGVYFDGIFTVNSRYFMYGEHRKATADFKSLEIVFLGNAAACYYFTDKFMMDSILNGFSGLVDAGSIGIYSDAECTILVDISKPITTNTTLYIEKIANQSVDKDYYGTYVVPITVNEETDEIIEGLPYFVGDAITHGDITMNYVVTKVDGAYILTIISFGSIFDTISICFDETLNAYVMDGYAHKVDMSNYSVVSFDVGYYRFGFAQFIILKGKSISDEIMRNLDSSLSYIKDDETTIYNGEPITDDITLYVCKNANIDLLVGKQFSAGEYGTIYFNSGNQYSLRGSNTSVNVNGKYKFVLSDNKFTVTLSLEGSDTTYALGIYDIELETLVITLNDEEITYRLPKYFGHTLLKNNGNYYESSRFILPINSNYDTIYFDVFGYVHTNTGNAEVVGTYEISNDCTGGKYSMTVNFGANWNPASTIMTGYYDTVSNRVVLNKNTYYDSDGGVLMFHPLKQEGLTSVRCYDKSKNWFSLWGNGHINASVGSKYYSALCTDIILVQKGVYELNYIVMSSYDENGNTGVDMTKIMANIFDKTYTVTVGGQDFVFLVPPYGIIEKEIDSPFVYESSTFTLDVLGNYVYTISGGDSIGTFTAIVEASKIIFKFYDASGAFLYNAYIDGRIDYYTLFVTIDGKEIAFSSKIDKPKPIYPELFGSYVSVAGATDTVVLDIYDGHSFILTVNDRVMIGSYEALGHGNNEYSFRFFLESIEANISATCYNGIINITIEKISYTLTKVGGGEQTGLSFRDELGNEVFMQANMSCSLILGGNKYDGSYYFLEQLDDIKVCEFQIGVDTVIAKYDLMSMTLTFTYLEIEYVLSNYDGQINPPEQEEMYFYDDKGNRVVLYSSTLTLGFYVNGTSEKGNYEITDKASKIETYNLNIAKNVVQATFDMNNNSLSFEYGGENFILYLNGEIPKL